jgi:pimeloyl-ACP methyl ester carboxylesterase
MAEYRSLGVVPVAAGTAEHDFAMLTKFQEYSAAFDDERTRISMNFFSRAHLTDLRGYGRLAADATAGITGLVETLHHMIARVADPTGTSRGVSRLVYSSIRAGTWLAGRGIDVALLALAPWIPDGAPTPGQEAVRAAINGIYGDHLAATGNPLAMPMRMRRDGRLLTLTRGELAAAIPDAGRRVLVMVHGLCTNDLRWRRSGHDHGAALARDLGYTPIYLQYNSGRHVVENGVEFAALLETLAAEWPVPLDELTIIGHSMGGLVARSAVQCARAEQHAWPNRLRRLVFLGTPHHGALLEQLGSWVEVALRASPYSAPFARLGAARSAGITDLRYGSITAEDGLRTRRGAAHPLARVVPLPAGIECFAIAATLGRRARAARDQLVGDGLVPLDSALGRHPEPERTLAFPPERQWIARETTHLGLMARAGVYAQLRKWLVA